MKQNQAVKKGNNEARFIRPLFDMISNAAGYEGNLEDFIPREQYRIEDTNSRELVNKRVASETKNDPVTEGILKNISFETIGTGLIPYPTLRVENFYGKYSKEELEIIFSELIRMHAEWSVEADVEETKHFNEIEFSSWRDFLSYGEIFWLGYMVEKPNNKYFFKIKELDANRIKTPYQLRNRENIYDGIEFDSYGAPVAYYIKETDSFSSDSVLNFKRQEKFTEHRQNVFHWFFKKRAEQKRGESEFMQSLSTNRSRKEMFDTELVSTIIASAISVFIASNDDVDTDDYLDSIYGMGSKVDKDGKKVYHQNIPAGGIMYGNANEKPHLLNANRPSNLGPFVNLVDRSMAMGHGIPYNVLFNDFTKMSYAGFRSVALKAQKAFNTYRGFVGNGLFSPVRKHVMEESFLRGELSVKEFYGDLNMLSSCIWVGPSEGMIDKLKETQADVLQMENGIKDLETVRMERGQVFKDRKED
jgi:lambda family phage portal protein